MSNAVMVLTIHYLFLFPSSSFTVPSGRALYFQPSVLDFGTQLVGLPRAETIYVHNPSQELPVTLISMFISSRHFHMPSFQRRIFGVGVSSGASNLAQKKPSVLIFPHIQSIQLTQTQGTNILRARKFQYPGSTLEYPHVIELQLIHNVLCVQEDESDTRILVLQLECSLFNKSNKFSQGFSFVTDKKPVVQISLSEKREKHEEFEKLKQYILEHISVLLVIPTGEPKINIYILNSGAKHLHVKEIQIVSKIESTVEFEPLPLSASAANFTHVASVVCKANSHDNKNKCLSKIGMQVLKGSYTLKTYPAFLITDGSGYEPPSLFHMKQKQNGRELLDIWMTNGFDFSFTVNDVIRPHEVEGLFKILNFSGPVTLPPGCWKVFSLQFTARNAPVNVMTSLVLVTSAGFSLEMPLQISSTMSEQGDLIIEASAECGTQCLLGMPATAGPQWQKSLLLDSSTWKVDIGLATELCDMWQNRKNLKTCSWPRLPMESGVTMDFGATLVNDSKMKHFTLKNPLASPITVQLLPLSLYPDPLGALDLLTKCVSLFGVCWMACYQACYILTEFSTPGTRHSHDSALTQDNSPVDTVSSSSARITGSCKTFVDSCSTSDKGKGKGSPAVANGPNRNQNGSKKNSGTPAQPQKKHKVSVYYSKYKVNPIATVATAAEEECLPMKEMDSLGDYMDQDPTTCNNNTDEDTALPEKSAQCIKDLYQSAEDEGEVAACLVPMEMHSKHNENLTETIGSRPDLYACSSEEKPLNNQVTRIQQCSNFFPFMEKKTWEKVDASTAKLREDAQLKKKPQERVEFNTTAANGKARRNSGKNRRKVAVIVGVPEHTVAVSTEKNRDLECKESRNFNKSRNRCVNGKQEAVKSCPKLDSPVKQMQNAVCLANPRRKCLDRRLFSDSGSDSGSSSGSVRASRGSWGSWSSLDGEKDHNSTKLHCTTATAKSVSSPYQTEEMWSAPSVPLTTDFRYSPPESLPCIPQGSIYNGFPWTVNSQCAIPYPYCEQSSYYPVLDAIFLRHKESLTNV
ncbi:UNVERIFIED_CONTAM: hypothetical protein FKN15_022858 [Acipenser sinensis]